jgi:hypothetical protein
MKRCLLVVIWLLGAIGVVSTQSPSKWVSLGSDRRLHYGTDARGNRIMDFSHAGYRGGGITLPTVRAARTLPPAAGDNTARIQAAIDQVSALTPGADGFRGAVVLERGVYDVAGELKMAASGVVLRGNGSGENGTTLKIIGPPHRFLDISGTGTWQPEGNSAAMTDAYVPSGASSFTVASASGFKAGDGILIQRPVTDKWIHFMGMDLLERDGQKQTWIKAGTIISMDRTIRSVAGNRITVDVPLSDSFDAAYLNPPGGSIVKYAFPGRIERIGLESLRVMSPAQDVAITQAQYTFLRTNAVSDAWLRDLWVQDTQNTITLGPSSRRMTLEDLHITHTVPFTEAASPADIAISGTQILVHRSTVTGQGVWPVVTQAGVTGPNVVLHFKSDQAGVAPHQRWATGLLVDSSEFQNGTERRPSVAFSNREYAGSGHGWSVGWAVAWNVTGAYLLIQQPPGAMNWCIGCTGRPPTILWHGNKIAIPPIPSETWELPGMKVQPASLYLEQLRERLGPGAVKNIGY